VGSLLSGSLLSESATFRINEMSLFFVMLEGESLVLAIVTFGILRYRNYKIDYNSN